MNIKKCQKCGEDFTPSGHYQVYCSKKCSKIANVENSRRKYNKIPRKLTLLSVDEMSFCQRFKYERLILDLSYDEIAVLFKLSKSTIINYEKESNVHSNHFVKKCCETFGSGFEKYYEKKMCGYCGKEFMPMTATRKYCSDGCSSIVNAVNVSRCHEIKRAERKDAFKGSKNKRVSIQGYAEIENQARTSSEIRVSYGEASARLAGRYEWKGRDL